MCYCSDCQEAGRRIEALPGAPPVCEPDGGTPLVTIAQRHWTCAEGRDRLRPMKLKDSSPTTRYVAQCCNSGMYVDFGPGYWISAFRTRFEDAPPPLEWRHMVKRRRSDLPYPDDLPRHRGFGLPLVVRLAKGWVRDLLGR